MKVFFTLANLDSGETGDFILEAESVTRVEELSDLLGWGEAVPLKWGVNGRELALGANVFDHVLDGDVVSCWTSNLDGDGATLLTAGIRLELIGGPSPPREWSLGFGSYSLGRDESSDIQILDDFEVSKRHAMLRVSPNGVEIEDQHSTNGVFVDESPIERSRVPAGSNLMVGTSLLSWSPLEAALETAEVNSRRRVNFSRPPRIHILHEAATVRFPNSTPERQKSPFPVLAVLAPVVFGVVMVLVQHSLTYLLFIAMSPLMAVANHFSANRRGKGTYRTLKERYDNEVREAKQELEQAVSTEVSELNLAYPGPDNLFDTVAYPNPRLWERRSSYSDFLTLRVGMTERAPSAVVTGSSADAEDGIAQLIEVPGVLNLAGIGVLGVAGPARLTQSFTRWLVAQAAALHAPEDLVMTLVTEIDSRSDWSWFRWLPHARDASFSGAARIGNSAPTITQLSKELDALVSGRLNADANESKPESVKGPAHLLVLDGTRYVADLPSLAHVLRAGPQVRVFVICVGDTDQSLPEECRGVATLSNRKDPEVSLRVDESTSVLSARADQVSVEWCEWFARFLAPIRLNRLQDSESTLPATVRLLNLLNLERPSGPDVVQRWTAAGRSTRAPVGEAVSGPMVIDVSKDGPHGLVAGTTGSGKSELLQTLIASLAVANRPDAMNFVLVDYKGGSAFKDCARLPHTVGMVTDLDGHLTERALASLGAELRRRERLLQQSETKDIEDYWRATDDSGQPTLARLVLVIDEFASLVEELPSFVEGLVDLARRGRSLGIHLVLATQRPSGVVSPAIKTNTNLRIAMRVTDAADSVDVIDSPLASRIGKDVPGRGYVRAGHERLTEFQAARVGGRRPVRDQTSTIMDVARWETLGVSRVKGSSDTIMTGATDLSDLVTAVVEASNSMTITAPQSPWLAPLAELVTFIPAWTLPPSASPFSAIFGIEDRPEMQAQAPAYLDLERGGHLLVAGDAGSGRSTFLRTLAASIATRCSARDVHLFGIDCGNGALLPLIELPQCGAVVSRTEVERVDRLIARLLDEVARRQQILSLGGFSSIADQRTHAPVEERLPYVVVLVDRWEGFVSEFDALDSGRLVTSFLHLMKEAPGVGVRVVVAGDRTALSARFSSLVESTIALRLNDRSNYSMIGVNPRQLPEQVGAGRGFRGGAGTEIQIALLDEDPSGPAQGAALRAIARDAAARDSGLDADELPEPIATLPQVIALSAVSLRTAFARPGPHVLVGVGGDRAEPQWLHLATHGPGFVIGGPPRSGRSNALLVAVRSLIDQGQSVLVIIGRTSLLAQLEGVPGVVTVLDGRTATGTTFTDALSGTAGPVVVAIDDAELLSDAPIAEALTSFIRTARDFGHAMIVAGTTADLASGFRGFAPEVRKSKSGLILCPSSPGDGELVGVRLSRAQVFPGPPGRGIFVTPAGINLVQVPVDDSRISV